MPDIIGKAKEKYREIMESEKIKKIKRVGKAAIGMMPGILGVGIGKIIGKGIRKKMDTKEKKEILPIQREIRRRVKPVPKMPKKPPTYRRQIA